MGRKADTRTLIQSGYWFETTYGYPRAVRVGSIVFVSGMTARTSDLDGDVSVQLRGAIAIAATALEEVDAVARVHGDVFGEIRSASTLLQVSGLTPSTALVDIEMTAVVADPR